MGYRLTHPVFFGPDRLPSVQIGDPAGGSVVSCDLTFVGRDHALWRVRITDRGTAIYDDRGAIRQPVREYGRGRQAAEVLASTLAFLLADAEGYRSTMGSRPPRDGWVFTAAVAEWAYLNETELCAAADQLTGQPPAAAADPVDYFAVYRTEPETVFEIPPLHTGQPRLTVAIAALGGGTVGQAYADNQWIYAVHLDGARVASGTDLRSGGFARTHQQMAAVLAATLADAVTSPAALADQRERISLWANDIETEEGDGHE